VARNVDDESDSDLDSFIEDDGGYDGDSGDEFRPDEEAAHGGVTQPSEHAADKQPTWKTALREALNGYDASQYAELDRQPVRVWHTSFDGIAAEEAKAARIARETDRLEAEKAAAVDGDESDARARALRVNRCSLFGRCGSP